MKRTHRWAAAILVCALACAGVSGLAQSAPAPEEVTFTSGTLTLHGLLWKPAGAGPFPALLYSHGSGKPVRLPAKLGPAFASHGYVFFLPHRRGHGLSADQAPYMSDVLDAERKTHGTASWSRLLVKMHETDHLNDTIAALAYLKTRQEVNVAKMAIAGCSFGGIQTVLVAERELGVKAAVDFAGAAMTWTDSPDMRRRMTEAVGRAKVPIYFAQAENDYNLGPSRTLSAEMKRLGKPYEMKIFPPFGTTKEDGHGGFCYSGAEAWGPDVFAFLSRTLGT